MNPFVFFKMISAAGRGRNPDRAGWLCSCLVLAVGTLQPATCGLAAEASIPPFVAEGRLVTTWWGLDETLPSYQTDAKVVFLHSNGWWQVAAGYQQPQKPAVVMNCRNIPDGTRNYSLFAGQTNQALTIASACPMTFPPPGRAELLVPWLTLCPKPELPVLDDQRMRRFINLPVCRPDIFNIPENEGFFAVNHLGPEQWFLSELYVTNNGFSVESNVQPGRGLVGEVKAYSNFKRKFTEFEYRLIETTNLNGITFPLRAVCRRFLPRSGSQDHNDLRALWVSEMTVTNFSFALADLAKHLAPPAEMFAMDARPPGLPEGVTVDYRVHNDEWKSVSDSDIKWRVRRARSTRGLSSDEDN